jgi:hypothetical protein
MPGISVQELFGWTCSTPLLPDSDASTSDDHRGAAGEPDATKPTELKMISYGQAVAPPLGARSSVSDVFHVEHVAMAGRHVLSAGRNSSAKSMWQRLLDWPA